MSTRPGADLRDGSLPGDNSCVQRNCKSSEQSRILLATLIYTGWAEQPAVGQQSEDGDGQEVSGISVAAPESQDAEGNRLWIVVQQLPRPAICDAGRRPRAASAFADGSEYVGCNGFRFNRPNSA